MENENAFLQKLDKIGNLTQVVCLSLFLTGVSVQGVSAETGFPISQSVQQTKTVTGQVVDETGEPVIGASVVVEGTTNGTITDFDGKFALQVPSGKKVVISFVGYVPQTIAPKQGKDFRVVLKEDSKILDEVVIVGYGTQKAKNVTGAISTVNPKEIEDLPVGNLGAALQGMVTGLSVSGGQTRPGAAASLSIRQPMTLSKDGGDTNPIYVVDDFIVDATTFNNLDPSEVENISVLKDAAASVYGARGGQGAILVKTKRGKEGDPRISYSGQFGYNDEIARPKMMDSYHYGLFYNAIAAANGNDEIKNHKTDLFQADELEAMRNINYDWLDDAWKGAFSMKHNLNLSGGTQKATYFAGVSYYTQSGNLGTLDYERWNYRAGVDVKLASHFKVGLQASGDYGKNEKTFNKVGGENDENDYNTLLLTPRYIPAYIDGLPLLRYGFSNSQQNNIQQYNYYALEELGNISKNDPQNMRLNASVEYDFDWNKTLKGLKLKMSYSKSISTDKNSRVGSKYTAYSFKTRGGSGNHLYIGDDLTNESNLQETTVKNGNQIWRTMNRTDSYQLNFVANYNRTFGKHTIGALFSVERSERNYEYVRYYREDPLEVNNGEWNTATGKMDGLTERSESGLLSYIGRVNYSYNDRYMMEFLVRSDASTKFAPSNYWGVFPSLSLGWVVSEENWFKEKIQWLEYLKVRGSVGMLGKDNTKAWLWRQNYSYQANKGAVFGTNEQNPVGMGLKKGAAPNADVHWDKSYKFNFGIDTRFLNGRLSFGLDAYLDKNTEMLVQRDGLVPVTIGGALAAENYDAIDAYGVELSFGWRDRVGDINYFVKLNTAFTGTKYRKHDWPDIIGLGDIYKGGPTDMGKWGYDCIGMFRTQQEIDEFVTKNNVTKYMGLNPEQIKPGMLIYRDVRGKQNPDGSWEAADGIIDSNDRIRLSKKNSNPYGFSLNFGGDWKGLSLSAQLSASWGGWAEIPSAARDMSTKKLNYINAPVFWNDVFVPEDVVDDQGNIVAYQNLDAKYPNMGFSVNNETSNFWRVNSLRMTLKTLTIGYKLPSDWVKKINIEGCRFTLTGTNLLSFFNPYPENFCDPLSVYGAYPTLRNVSLGVNISF